MFPPPEAGEPLRVSATTFVGYRRCPASALARLEGHYPPETERSFRGALVHRLIARHLKQGPIPPEQVEHACRQEIGAGMNHKLAGAGLKPSRLREVIAESAALYERFRRFPLEGFVGAEMPLEHQPAEGVLLVGKVDAVFEEEGGVRLVDWKSEGLGDPADQLAFYALVWTLQYGGLPGSIEAVSLNTGERFRATPSLAELSALAAEVSEMVTAVRRVWRGELQTPRTGGPWCRYCPILEGCPEGQAAVTVMNG